MSEVKKTSKTNFIQQMRGRINAQVNQTQGNKPVFGNGNTQQSGGTSVEHTSSQQKKKVKLTSGEIIEVEGKDKTITAKDGTVYFVKPSGTYTAVKDKKVKYYTQTGREISYNEFKTLTEMSNHVMVKNKKGVSVDLNQRLQTRIATVVKDVKKEEDKNGVIGGAWSWLKNNVIPDSWCDSSNQVRELQKKEQNLLKQFNTQPQNRAKIFKELTGCEYTAENQQRFVDGEIKLKSEQKLDGYKEGQATCVDVVSDIGSGIVAFGAYSAGIALAPVTGGASIAVGVGVATAAGSLTKVAIKAGDAVTGGRKYDSLGSDLLMGAVNGAISPLTAGFGGAVGKTVAVKAGVKVVEAGAKQVVSNATKQGAKQGFKRTFASAAKEGLKNPGGYKYVGTGLKGKAAAAGAYFVEGAVDGSLSGGAIGGIETAKNGGSLEDITKATIAGTIAGGLMGGVMNSGMHSKGIAKGEDISVNPQSGAVLKDAKEEVAKDAVETSVVKNADEVVPTPKPQGGRTEISQDAVPALTAKPAKAIPTPQNPNVTWREKEFYRYINKNVDKWAADGKCDAKQIYKFLDSGVDPGHCYNVLENMIKSDTPPSVINKIFSDETLLLNKGKILDPQKAKDNSWYIRDKSKYSDNIRMEFYNSDDTHNIVYFDKNTGDVICTQEHIKIGERIEHIKITDKEHNIEMSQKFLHPKKDELAHPQLLEENIIFKNNLGEELYTQQTKLNKLGQYEIKETYPNGRTFKTGMFEKTRDGGVESEKVFYSLNGDRTNIVYAADKDGNYILNETIRTKDNEILSTVRKTFKKLSENKTQAKVNDTTYTAEFKNDKILLTETKPDGSVLKSEIKITDDIQNATVADGELLADRTIADALKNITPDQLVAIKKSDVRKILLDYKNEVRETAAFNPRNKTILLGRTQDGKGFKSDASLISHEIGHAIDDINGITKNPELIKIFEQEKSELLKQFPDAKIDNMEYLVKNTWDIDGTALEEGFADTNSFQSGLVTERGHKVRNMDYTHYFSRTRAKMNELRTKALQGNQEVNTNTQREILKGEELTPARNSAPTPQGAKETQDIIPSPAHSNAELLDNLRNKISELYNGGLITTEKELPGLKPPIKLQNLKYTDHEAVQKVFQNGELMRLMEKCLDDDSLEKIQTINLHPATKGNNPEYRINITNNDNSNTVIYFKIDSVGKIEFLSHNIIKYRDVVSKLPNGSTSEGATWGNVIDEGIYDSNGNIIQETFIRPSQTRRGESEITVTKPYKDGNLVTEKVGTVKIYDKVDENGNHEVIHARKRVESPDGSTSRQIKVFGKDRHGTTYKILDKDGNVKLDVKRSQWKIDENHYRSSHNGERFDIKYENDGITVSMVEGTGSKERLYKPIKISFDELDPQLIDLYKQLPGDYLYKLHLMGVKVKYEPKLDFGIIGMGLQDRSAYFQAEKTIKISERSKNNPEVFAHEYSHAVDDYLGLVSDSEYLRLSKQDWDDFSKNSGYFQKDAISYYTQNLNPADHNPDAELIAGVGQTIAGFSDAENFNQIGDAILFQNYSRTIAYVGKKLDMPVEEFAKAGKKNSDLALSSTRSDSPAGNSVPTRNSVPTPQGAKDGITPQRKRKNPQKEIVLDSTPKDTYIPFSQKLDECYTNGEPRFTQEEKEMLEGLKNEHFIVNQLVEERAIIDGVEVPRFSASEIKELVNMQVDEFNLEKILAAKNADDSSPLFSFENIKELAEVLKEDSENIYLINDVIDSVKKLELDDHLATFVIKKLKDSKDKFILSNFMLRIPKDKDSHGMRSIINNWLINPEGKNILATGKVLGYDVKNIEDWRMHAMDNLNTSIENGNFKEYLSKQHKTKILNFNLAYDKVNDTCKIEFLGTDDKWHNIELSIDWEGKITENKHISCNTDEFYNRTLYLNDGSQIVTKGEKYNYATGFSKEYIDSSGNLSRKEEIKPSGIRKGEFDITVTSKDANGNMIEEKIGTVKRFEDINGTRSRRRVTAPDGTITRQIKLEEKRGFSTSYDVISPDGETLYKSRRSHVKVDDNHYISNHNGQRYDIQFNNDEITVKTVDKNGAEKTVTLGSEIFDKELLPLMKKLPGDYLVQLKELDIKVKYRPEEGAEYWPKYKTIYMQNIEDGFEFAHEFGHALDHLKLGRLENDEEFVRLYNEAVENFRKQATDTELETIDYFTGEKGKRESVAEMMALLSGLHDETADLGVRSIVLQQNFAKPLAYAAKKLEAPVGKVADSVPIYKQAALKETESGIKPKTPQGGVPTNVLATPVPANDEAAILRNQIPDIKTNVPEKLKVEKYNPETGMESSKDLRTRLVKEDRLHNEKLCQQYSRPKSEFKPVDKNNISKDKKDIIIDLTEEQGYYSEVQEKLRLKEPLTKEEQNWLDKVLAQTETLDEDTTLYRFVTDYDGFEEAINSGTYKLDTLTSTYGNITPNRTNYWGTSDYTDEGLISRPYMLIFRAKKGQKIIDCSLNFQKEGEVVIPPSQCKVVKVNNNERIIELDIEFNNEIKPKTPQGAKDGITPQRTRKNPFNKTQENKNTAQKNTQTDNIIDSDFENLSGTNSATAKKLAKFKEVAQRYIDNGQEVPGNISSAIDRLTVKNDFIEAANAKNISITDDEYAVIYDQFKDNIELLKSPKIQEIVLSGHDKCEFKIEQGSVDGTFTLKQSEKIDIEHMFDDITDFDTLTEDLYRERTLIERFNESSNYSYDFVTIDGKPELLRKEVVLSDNLKEKTVISQMPDGSYRHEHFTKDSFQSNEGSIQSSNSSLIEEYDNQGNLLSRTESKPSESTKRKNVTVTQKEIYDAQGNVTDVQNLSKVTTYNTKRDIFKVDREFTSPAGVKSRQVIINRPNSRFTDFQVRNQRVTRRFSKGIDATTTRINGDIYRTKFTNDGIEINVKSKSGKSETVKLSFDELDPQFIELYKQLPGDMLYKMQKLGISVKEKDWGAAFDPDKKTILISKGSANDPFTFAHEFGHALDWLLMGGLHNDKELIDIYQRELNTYLKKSGSAGSDAIAYFTPRNKRYDNAGLGEVIAELEAIRQGLLHDDAKLLERARLIQGNLPETAEYIMKKLDNADIEHPKFQNPAEYHQAAIVNEVPTPQGARNLANVIDIKNEVAQMNLRPETKEVLLSIEEQNLKEILKDSDLTKLVVQGIEIVNKSEFPFNETELNKLLTIWNNEIDSFAKRMEDSLNGTGTKVTEEEYRWRTYIIGHMMNIPGMDAKLITDEASEIYFGKIMPVMEKLQAVSGKYDKNFRFSFDKNFDFEHGIEALKSVNDIESYIQSLETALKKGEITEEQFKNYNKQAEAIRTKISGKPLVAETTKDFDPLNDIQYITNMDELLTYSNNLEKSLAEGKISQDEFDIYIQMFEAKTNEIMNTPQSSIAKESAPQTNNILNAEMQAKLDTFKPETIEEYMANGNIKEYSNLLELAHKSGKINDTDYANYKMMCDMLGGMDSDFEIIGNTAKKTAGAELTQPNSTRTELKAELGDGKPVKSTPKSQNIPAGKFNAPGRLFAETDEAFKGVLTNNKYDVLYMHQKYKITGDLDEFINDMYSHYVRETDIGRLAPKLKIESIDNETEGLFITNKNTIKLSTDYVEKESDVARNVAHELNHWFQNKEQLITGNEGPEIVAYNITRAKIMQLVNNGTIKTQDELERTFNKQYQERVEELRRTYSDLLISDKYPHNTNPSSPYFKKANEYNKADMDYNSDSDDYWTNFREDESFRRGDDAQNAYDQIINQDLSQEDKAIDIIMSKISNADTETKLTLLDIAINHLKNSNLTMTSPENFAGWFLRKYVDFAR